MVSAAPGYACAASSGMEIMLGIGLHQRRFPQDIERIAKHRGLHGRCKDKLQRQMLHGLLYCSAY